MTDNNRDDMFLLVNTLEVQHSRQQKSLDTLHKQLAKNSQLAMGFSCAALIGALFVGMQSKSTTVTTNVVDESRTTYRTECKSTFLSFGRCEQSNRRTQERDAND